MIASLSKFNSRRLSLPSETESKKRSMIKELRVDYRKCFTNSNLSPTAKRLSPTTLQSNFTGFSRRRIQFNLGVSLSPYPLSPEHSAKSSNRFAWQFCECSVSCLRDERKHFT